jgi:hypothetical protein
MDGFGECGGTKQVFQVQVPDRDVTLSLSYSRQERKNRMPSGMHETFQTCECCKWFPGVGTPDVNVGTIVGRRITII